MSDTRRSFVVRLTGIAGALGALAVYTKPAKACLWGTWYLECPYCKQVDQVDDGTCQHECERCGKQVFDGNKVTVVCPNGHRNRVETGSRDEPSTYCICATCNTRFPG